jgi:hypothetical protein
MTDPTLSEQDWQIRAFIYTFFVANARPPSIAEMARKFNISNDEIRDAYNRLNAAHHIFLEPGTDTIRMAHPLSAVITDYRVQVDNRWLYANCAWDSLGIAAMCHTDAHMEATLPLSRETVTYRIQDGELMANANWLVHFALPVRQWYDDLIHT